MIYKSARKTAAAFIVITSIIASAVFCFQHFLPDRFFVNDTEDFSYSSLYKNFINFDFESNKAKAVFSQTKNTSVCKAKFMGVFPIKEVSVTVTDEKIVKVCGTPFGVKMFTDGVLVVGFSRIECAAGSLCPAVDAGLLEGDILKAIDGEPVKTNEDAAEKIKNSGGRKLSLLIERDGKDIIISVKPEMLADKSGYKAGFWVRDSSAGIGTLTFYDPQTLFFAGLGHAVCDIDTGEVLPLLSGEIVPAAITSVKKGKAGAPGELGGTFTGNKNIGIVKTNNETGLFGVLDYEIEGTSAPIAHKQDIYEGAAVILSTVDGTRVEEYDIIIEKISLSDESKTKNMVIKVVDEDLIEATGGIVQGMSGSPILQDGKLIGAVTHVFVNDPTKGYGIFIENMLEAAG
ncbi:MAG: SpoIVB peptidase [Oscillospiraceae bacterium]|nr:SpoIVB peptidase [Oscillospiraceae bacterium]